MPSGAAARRRKLPRWAQGTSRCVLLLWRQLLRSPPYWEYCGTLPRRVENGAGSLEHDVEIVTDVQLPEARAANSEAAYVLTRRDGKQCSVLRRLRWTTLNSVCSATCQSRLDHTVRGGRRGCSAVCAPMVLRHVGRVTLARGGRRLNGSHRARVTRKPVAYCSSERC